MSSTDAPPPYTPASSTSSSLPPNHAPTAQPTCPPSSSPLRDPSLDLQSYIPALKRYLRLLSRFHELQAQVEGYDDKGPLGALSPAERWKLFLHLAVERLQKWITIFGDREELPWSTMPPDVALVLVVWMTSSPGLFTEDIWRMHESLLGADGKGSEWLRRGISKLEDVWKLVSGGEDYTAIES